MAEKKTEKAKKVTKYKATDTKQFIAFFTSDAPFYDELSKGESVELDVNNKHVKNWLSNNIIKEI